MLKHKVKRMIDEKGQQYCNIYYRYENMMLNAFKWEGLPKGIEGRHIERALYEYGNAILFIPTSEELNLDTDIEFRDNFLILGATCGSNYNVLGEPTEYIGNGYGQTFRRNLNNAVLCRNTPNSQPSINYIKEFTAEMVEVKRTIRTNIIQQKFPFIIPTTAENELTMKNLMNDVENGKFTFFVDKNIDLSGIKILDTKVPYIAGQVNEYRFELEREILTFMGLNNHFEKAERLLVDEVNSNNDYVDSYIDLMFNERLEFCKKAKQMYDLNIKVSKRYGMEEEFKKEEENIDDN